MDVGPQDLVRWGDRYLFPDNGRYPEQAVILSATSGPPLTMRFGALAVADPWYPEVAPQEPVILLGGGAKPTRLSTIARARADNGEVERMAVAASVGDLDQVVTWHPLVRNEQHMHLESDSALGAFYEISDGPALQPVFEDSLHMKGIYDRALTELIVTMDVAGRSVAAAFLCPDGSGLYPVWAGFDRDMSAVAVVVDLLTLRAAQRRID